MNILSPISRQNILSVTTSIILFASVPVVLAWTTPSATPPNNNVPAPINVGTNYQIKQGKLGLYGSDTSLRISKEDSYVPSAANLISSLLLGVNGKVGADKYCDELGNNCIDLANLNGNSSVIVNNNTNNNTSTTCTQKARYVPFALSANANNVTRIKEITLPAGNWVISGQGAIARGNNIPGFSIILSKNGSYTKPTKTFVEFRGQISREHRYVGLIGSNGSTWEIKKDVGTFTLTQPEKLRIYAGQALFTGTLIFEGPEEFVCSTTPVI